MSEVGQSSCGHCGGAALYSMYERGKRWWGYDAQFCAQCDLWLEPRCREPGCEYCVARPERPSAVPYPVERYVVPESAAPRVVEEHSELDEILKLFAIPDERINRAPPI